MTHDNKPMILAISGSLKNTSSNSTVIREMAVFASNARFEIYGELEMLPQFNPDKEAGNEAVQRFKHLLKEAQGVIISTPEYAFGVPGALKNALDWTVSSGELNEKPVIAISASPLYEGGSKALASLRLTLSALGTKMNAGSSLSIANIQNKISNGRISDAPTLQGLKALYDHLMQKVNNGE
jgi:chromate reductase, NAD(P)H dehydrogenase (quinone)